MFGFPRCSARKSELNSRLKRSSASLACPRRSHQPGTQLNSQEYPLAIPFSVYPPLRTWSSSRQRLTVQSYAPMSDTGKVCSCAAGSLTISPTSPHLTSVFHAVLTSLSIVLLSLLGLLHPALRALAIIVPVVVVVVVVNALVQSLNVPLQSRLGNWVFPTGELLVVPAS